MSDEARDETWVRVALACCAGGGWLAAAVVIVGAIDVPAAWPAAIVGLAALVLLPLVHAEVVAGLARVRGLARVGAPLSWAAQAAPLFLVPAPRTTVLLFGALMLAQGHLYLGSQEDRNAAFCLAAAPLLNVIALAFAPSAWLLALLPLNAAAALVTLSLCHGRFTRRRARRGRPRPDTPRERRGRLAAAVPLAVVALGLSLGLFVVAEKLLSTTAPDDAPARAPGLGETSPDTAAPAGPGGRPGGGDSHSPGATTEDLSFGGGTSPFSEEVVLRVRRVDGPRRRRALHLRHQTLDEIHEDGARTSRGSLPPLWRDGEDEGGTDGWTWVETPPRGASFAEYEIVSRPLPVLDFGWTVLFSPAPVLAVQVPSLRYHTDQILAAPYLAEEEFSYRVRVLERGLDLDRVGDPGPQYLALPPESAALGALRARAETLVRGAPDDVARVRAVVDHFLEGYAYERTGDDFRGIDALAQLLVDRRGYCTLFSAAAAVMLRTQGIPTRLATGFVAHEWEILREEWIVRERDAHAWLEVYFEGEGWVPFDPTPSADDGGGGGFDPLAAEEPAWGERLGSALEDWLGEGGGSLGDVVAAALSGPIELVRREPSLVLPLMAAALGALHVLLRRRRARGARESRGARGQDRLDPAVLLQRRILRNLARRGFARARGETVREFALRVAAADDSCAELPRAAALLYRARFGDRPLGEREREFLGELASRLETLERLEATPT